jgi:hypothetical protein
MRYLVPAVALLGIVLFTAPVKAQISGAASPSSAIVNLSPYSVYGPGLTYRPPSRYFGPYTSLSAGTTIRVPDGGEGLAASYSRAQEGSNSFGAPGLGKVPYISRGVRNTGTGKNMVHSSLSVRVRIIRMYEEEERQTGVRSH